MQLPLDGLYGLTTLTSLHLGVPLAYQDTQWAPHSLRRLAVSRGCGAAWLGAVAHCAGSLESLELASLAPDDYGGDGNSTWALCGAVQKVGAGAPCCGVT